MGTSSLGALAGMGMMMLLVMLVVGIAVGALLLCVAFRLVVGYMPSYLRALGAVVLTAVVDFVASIVLGMLMGGVRSTSLMLAVEFLVGAWVVNYLLVSLDGSRIGYGKACLVQLVYMVIGILIALVFAALFAMLFGAAMFGMH